MSTRGIRLKSLGDTRRFLAKIINQLNRDEITEGKARVFGYLATTLASVQKDSDLEERVKALEATIKDKE